MNKAHPLSITMVVQSLDMNKNLFRHKENGEKVLGPELMYLTNYTWPDIAFSVNLLIRYSSTPRQRH